MKCWVKTLNLLLLNFLGVLIMGLVEILDSLMKVNCVLAIILGGVRGFNCVENFFYGIKSKLLGLNRYQLESLEQQRKVTHLIFENLPFTILQILIFNGLIDCPELIQGKSLSILTFSLFTAFLSLCNSFFDTAVNAKSLREAPLIFLMTKLTANNSWIPFIHYIASRECDFNINFSNLRINIPFLSNTLGIYKKNIFQFSDNTLKILLNELTLW
jgi:hypothetical protein